MPQLNSNVGIGGLDAGLCMISSGPQLFDIEIAESGLQQATIRFATFDPGRWRPARGTKCTDFIGGNQRTTDVLGLFPYLGAQTSVIRVNGEGDGVHGLDVLVQGAIFDTALSAMGVIQVPITNRGLEYTVVPSVVFTGGEEIIPAHCAVKLKLDTRQIVNGGTGYHVGDVLTLVGGIYDRPVQIRVDAVGTGGSIKVADGGDNHVSDAGKYSTIPSNTCSLSGGSGTGATVDVTWQIGYVDVIDPGEYQSTPTAALVGGTFTQAGSLGAVIMSDPQIVGTGDGSFTKPFDPVTTVKDTVEIPIFTTQSGTSTVPQARVCTLGLDYDIIQNPGGPILQLEHPSPYTDGSLPPLDGVRLGPGDRFLLADGSRAAGIWKVISPGGMGAPWYARRPDDMNESAEVIGSQVNVAEGSANSGLWHCTTAEPFTMDADPISFEKATGTAQHVPTYKATIEYRAIELNFEYVADGFSSHPRFLRNEYTRDADGNIVIDPITGKTMELQIDSVVAVQQIVDANGQVVDGQTVALDEATWRAAVKYVGTAAQFEQTPAGPYYHVKETATIKIAPIVPA